MLHIAYPKSLAVGVAFGLNAGRAARVREDNRNWATMCKLVVKSGN